MDIMNLKFNKIVLIMCVSICIFASCQYSNNTSLLKNYDESGAIIKIEDSVYYYDNPLGLDVNLCRYNTKTNSSEIIDVISKNEPNSNQVLGLTRLFRIDDRIYYGKQSDSGEEKLSIYMFTSENPYDIIHKGEIDILHGEGCSDRMPISFNIMEGNDGLYILCTNGLYHVDSKSAEIISDDITSIWSDGTETIIGMHINGKSAICELNKDCSLNNIIEEDEIKKYNNDNLIIGDFVTFRNIYCSNEYIYFLTSSYASPIYRISIRDKNIECVTKNDFVAGFKLINDNIFFINSRGNLEKVSLDGSDSKTVLSNVNDYTVYGNCIYYHEARDHGYAKKLYVYDMNTETRKFLIE